MPALWVAIGVALLALGFLSTLVVYAGMVASGRESRREEEREQCREDRAA